MEKDQNLLNRIESLTSNQDIGPDKLSRLNALLYRIVVSNGLVSYDINDIALIFRENNVVDFVELEQRDRSTTEFIASVIDAFNGYAGDSTTESVHIHFFVNKEGYNDVINILGKLISNGINTSLGIWHSINQELEVALIINKKSATCERNFHR